MLTRLDYRPNGLVLECDYISSFETGKRNAVVLAEKPDVCTLRILFYETKQGNAPSPCLLDLHKCSRRELERRNRKFLFRYSRSENLSRYHDHIARLGESRHLPEVEDDSGSSRFTEETCDR